MYIRTLSVSISIVKWHFSTYNQDQCNKGGIEMGTQKTFLFAGETLAFDFVNTEMIIRRKPVEMLAAPDDLMAWWNAALDHYQLDAPEQVQIAPATFDRARSLRSALRRIFTAVVEQSEVADEDLDLLNEILSSGHTRLVATPGHRFALHQVSDEDSVILLTIAQSAAWLLTECERQRLHKCRNERCVLMFLDTTKNASRVWCSIECMNRARSIERYEQSRQ